MKLKPYLPEDTEEDPMQRSISEALQTVGLKRGKSGKLELDEIRGIFENEGVGIKDVANTVGSLMRSSEREETRLRAAELALKVQGVFKEMNENSVPVININIVGDGNKTLIDLVCPS